MSAAEILKLIEEVDPADTAKLDEIDKLVEQYLQNRSLRFEECDRCGLEPGFVYFDEVHGHEIKVLGTSYCRSRDALKAIRPEGWQLEIEHWWALGWRCAMVKSPENGQRVDAPIYPDDAPDDFEYGFLPTEELAELHAIIQAIEYKRAKC